MLPTCLSDSSAKAFRFRLTSASLIPIPGCSLKLSSLPPVPQSSCSARLSWPVPANAAWKDIMRAHKTHQATVSSQPGKWPLWPLPNCCQKTCQVWNPSLLKMASAFLFGVCFSWPFMGLPNKHWFTKQSQTDLKHPKLLNTQKQMKKCKVNRLLLGRCQQLAGLH